FELHLWAPTALSVEALTYEGPKKSQQPTAHAMTAGEDGVWSLSCPRRWSGKYYTYRVQAYHPLTGKIETMEAPDPYSAACSADAGRSLICQLPPWDDSALSPAPPFNHRADAVIYAPRLSLELHVRDFSARDSSVASASRGKYLAFEQEGTNGDRHLRKLAAAGLTHVHLLPTFDFGTVPERAEDRAEPVMPSTAGPASEGQQLAVMEVADSDAFNWGYDPVLYGVPEGSYASDPDGLARVLEHRRMVAGLHKKGLRVVADVVFNHVFGSGPEGSHSVLDKCVPGYYLRRSEDGRVENSTCMNNTATERYMMERLVVDMVLRWAFEHRMDGFRFDLMGHITLQCMQKCRAALDDLSLEEHGIDGPRLLLYGEGWEFGEIAGGARGNTACQRLLAGTGIASFNDHLRSAVLGGNAFEDPRKQGFATGLALRAPADKATVTGTGEQDLRMAADVLRVCLAAGLQQFRLEQDCLGKRNLLANQVHGGQAAYVAAPEEVVNFICVHDNETLYDSTVWKMSPESTDPEERMRANWLCSASLAFGHGVPLFHAGDELLRSKSLDRDSYNSGDWFNLLDFTGEESAFGTGLPPWGKNHPKWELMKPLLREPSLRPTKEMAVATTAKFCELLGIRSSTPLLGLREAADVMDKVRFPGCGPDQIPGVVVMEVRNGPSSAEGADDALICDKYARVVVVLSARPDEVRVVAPPSPCGGTLALHPLQAESADSRTREARVDEATDELVIPALTAAAFVEILPDQPGFKPHERRAQFRPPLRERPVVGDGLGLLTDPACVPFRGHFEYRWKVYTDLRKHITETAGSLTEFACGFTRLGFTKAQETGAITYREWLPPAKAVSLVGDFNSWDEAATPLERDAFGTWEVTLPANAIAHRTKVKFCATKHDGSKVYRVPAWIKWSCPDLGKFGSTYDGYYWDPSQQAAGEDYCFQGFESARPSMPSSLRIYEAHVGMSSTEPKCNSYLEFARDVLPRIKEAGYNCVQLMAIMEHSYYGSFGYHVTSPFAVSSRSGTPDEFKFLVDEAHRLGLLVLIDLVHSHVSNNADDGLNGMDFGQAESESYFMTGDRGYHKLWDSRLYCYKNYEVLRYLLSNLRWWLEEYNCDGFRFDGVTSMLYHHHGLYMSFTGNYEEYFGMSTDVDAVVYLMLASELVRSVRSNAVLIAEDVSGMPGLCVPVAEGGIGFDYRLAMSLPDMWISLLKDVKDENWGMNHIVSAMCNRRRGREKTIAYAESHDQSIVGDKTIAFWLMDAEMYTGMGDDGTPGTVVIERGMALHMIIRLLTIGLGGEGYLNFMGNEFGHPEWVDFPREGNKWSYAHCRRRFDLADSGLLRYRFLLKWDVAMHALEDSTGFASDEHLLVSSQHEEDKVIVFERANLIFVVNLHPGNDYKDYKVGVREHGRYKICLDSDAFDFRGKGRTVHDWTYFSEPEG
ncbi:SBE1, partial [Symbiodinium pilosum]